MTSEAGKCLSLGLSGCRCRPSSISVDCNVFSQYGHSITLHVITTYANVYYYKKVEVKKNLTQEILPPDWTGVGTELYFFCGTSCDAIDVLVIWDARDL